MGTVLGTGLSQERNKNVQTVIDVNIVTIWVVPGGSEYLLSKTERVNIS